MRFKLLVVGLLLTILSVSGQEADSLFRPKIGLVLSGGGAKGLAHIGVLKSLEKHHIRPDYISGTSMGAIVGSLYASGYSARQIDSIFHTMDFDAILYNRYDRKYLNIFEKEHGKRYILSFPFSIKNLSVQLPRGLNDAQNLFNVLNENMLHVNNINDFSRLRIPFVCPATDIVTGEQVLFNKGFLPAATTSSALLPSVYNPLDEKGKLLLDGGIVNNYPIYEARDMGADFIIGSDVQGRILSKNQITDLPAIMDQIVSFGMYKQMPVKKALTDVYIRPDIKGIGITDFEKIDTIIKRGEIAADYNLNQLKNLQQIQKDFTVKPLRYHRPDSLLFDQIILQGQRNFKREYILGKIAVRPHQKISYRDFLDGINNLIGTDNFAKVFYRFKVENAKKILLIELKERIHKAKIQLGFHFNDLYKINVIGNFTNKRIFTNNDMISLDVIGGDFFRYNLNYIIDNGFKLSWGFYSGLHRFSHQVYANDFFKEEGFSINKLDFNYFNLTNKLYFQANLNHFLYLRIGLQHQYKKLYTYVFSGQKNEAYYFGRNHYFGNFASINFDNRNDYDFPTKGLYLKFKWNYNWSSSDYYTDFKPFSLYRVDMNLLQKIYGFWLINPGIKAGLHYAKTHSYENIFYIGGFNRYDEYNQMVTYDPVNILSFGATKYAVFSLKNILKINKNHFITLGSQLMYYDNSDKLLPVYVKRIYGFHIGYGVKTFLGPMRFNWGRIPDLKRNSFMFSLGYNF
jgi:NTE family protein